MQVPGFGNRMLHCPWLLFRWQQHCHHSGEAVYDQNLKKAACMPFFRPKAWCCIVPLHCLQRQQHRHRFRWALYDPSLQKTWCHSLIQRRDVALSLIILTNSNSAAITRRSTVFWKPAATWVYVIPSSKDGMLHCPWSLLPMATTTMPSLRRSTVWSEPTEIWVCVKLY